MYAVSARTPQRIVHPLSKTLIRRVTPGLEYLQAKREALLPYRQAAAVLEEVPQLDDSISFSGTRDRTHAHAKQLELISSVTSRRCSKTYKLG